MLNNDIIINFNTALNEITELWQLKTIAESDSHWFKLIKFEGEFEWHTHDEDKVLMVLEGNMHIDFKNKDTVALTAGNTTVVPANEEHRPIADGVCGIMLIEKKARVGRVC